MAADQIKLLLDQQDKLYQRQSELKGLLEQCSTTSAEPVENGGHVSMEDWAGSFEWDAEADNVKFNVFGISKYRANQREVS